ncbi:unnamed protein product, partial [marine sediment metagenome]
NESTAIGQMNASWLADTDTNESAAIGQSNASWLSTFNETYDANLDTNESEAIGQMNASWLSIYNATYDEFAHNETIPSMVYTDTFVNGTFNQTLTDGLYANIQWDYNQSEPYDTFNYNMTLSHFFYNMSSPYDDFNYNETIPSMAYTDIFVNGTFNQSFTDTLYANIQWDYNQTTIDTNESTAVGQMNASWLDRSNATYQAKADYNATINLNMSYFNITGVDCMFFRSGGSWCTT